MKFVLSLLLGLFLSFSVSFAQEIKYSFGPVCSETKVICSDENEIPVCFSTNNRIHITRINVGGKIINQFEPSCDTGSEKVYPTCVDIANERNIAPSYIVAGCIEIPKCEVLESDHGTVATCSNGKFAKCLGSDGEEPSCNSDENSICKSGIAVCDYTWQASAESTYR